MPTRRGWAALGAGIALTILWVAFGESVFLAGAVFLLLAVGGGVASVRRLDPSVRIERSIVPVQVRDGDRAVVTLRLQSARRLYRPELSDEVAPLGTARFAAHRLDPRTPMVARYEVLCEPRGVYHVGPAQLGVRDPLGLARAERLAGTADRLVVYPRIDDLEGVPIGEGHDPTMSTSRSSYSLTGGEDFFTLREYRHGDDLRRVHWPSSARRDELMIKQLEIPWQSRALVVLDARAGPYRNSVGFEHAVRGAASVLHHLYVSGHAPRLWAGDPGTGTAVASPQTYLLAMERLATVQPLPALDLEAAASRLRRGGLAGGLLVLVTGAADEGDLGVYRSLGENFSRTVVMAVAPRDNGVIRRLRRAGVVAVLGRPGLAWGRPWKEAMERAWSTVTAG